ncbi:hypothetical protein [Micromonospora sp. AMSO31t]|uniref:hypothetical protein n=1 Tax=Micromonospora sp. AMSO31t TaxID=2650566 RepID=UPI00124B25F2|nr:hypothetical protein [Micromonospora sp. AMSO31t]KAB1914073.1 hypothetical protein F8274_08155 [Micromonospora sp. AMSO31t]
MNQSEEIKRRVGIFLAEEAMEREDFRLYVSTVRDIIANVTHRASRSSLMVILGAALFLLLSSGDLTEAEVFGVKAQNFSLFRLAIPAIMAYSAAHVVMLMNARAQLMRLYIQLMKQSFPKWSEAGLAAVPARGSSFFLTAPPLVLSDRQNTLAKSTFYVEGLIAIFLPVAFSLYAYISIFRDDTIGRGWAIASLGVTLIFMVLAYANMTVGAEETK